MKRFLLSAVLVLLSIITYAQDLAVYIPNDAVAVATIKGKNFLELLSVKEFNESFAGRKLLKKLSKETGTEFKDVAELGIQMDANSYYYYQSNDSIGFHTFLVPLVNASKFASLFKDKSDSIKKKNNLNILEEKEVTLLWDEQKAMLTIGSPRKYYFNDNAVAARYGLPATFDYDTYLGGLTDDYSSDTAVTFEKIDVYTDTAIAEEPMEEVVEEDVYVEEYDTTAIIDEDSYYEDYSVDTTSIDTTSHFDEDYLSSDYNDIYFNENKLKKEKLDSISKIWTLERAELVFSGPAKKSILSNPSYLKSIDPKAEASIWLGNLTNLYQLDDSFGKLVFDNGFFSSFGSLNCHTYFEADQFRVASSMTLEGEMAKSMKKIYSRKINRKFLKYIDSNKALGYLGYAINTKAYLQELPKMMSDLYSPMMLGMGADGEMVNIGIELFSTLLDEKAVGKMIKGDALIVLNGVTEREITYKDYEYDEEYNSTEVEKTKKESIPDFLFMASSDDTNILKKLLQYGEAKELITFENGIYKFNDPKGTFDVCLLIKNGIVFVGNSYNELQRIQKGSFKGHATANHRKMIRKNRFLAYFNPGKTINAIPTDASGVLFNGAPYLRKMKDMGAFYIKSPGVKGNTIKGEMVIETSKDYKNAFKYMFYLIESASK